MTTNRFKIIGPDRAVTSPRRAPSVEPWIEHGEFIGGPHQIHGAPRRRAGTTVNIKKNTCYRNYVSMYFVSFSLLFFCLFFNSLIIHGNVHNARSKAYKFRNSFYLAVASVRPFVCFGVEEGAHPGGLGGCPSAAIGLRISRTDMEKL